MKRFLSVIICVIIITTLFSACQSSESKYSAGLEAMNNENWDMAIEYFTDLNYEDSEDLLEKCKTEKGMHEKSDYDFLNTMSESIMKRYEKAENGGTVEDCVDLEIEMLGKFKNAEFFDKDLQALALSYIEGLEIEKESITLDQGFQQLRKQEGTAKRFATLKSLTDNYGLLEDNVDYRTNYYNKAEIEFSNYNALKAIEEDISKQFEGLVSEYVDYYTERIVLKNNTEYDYDMYMHFTFYDKNGTIIDTYEAFYENIKNGKKYNLDFYWPENAETFDWYTEEYNIK